MDHSVYEKADAGLCGAILYSAAQDEIPITTNVNDDTQGLAFRDFGDNNAKKREFKAKTSAKYKDGKTKTYSMLVELEDWPVANYTSASSISYSNGLKFVLFSSKSSQSQSLTTIS